MTQPKIFANLPAQVFVLLSPVIMGIVTAVCYLLAVFYGHVPIFLPYICECGAQPPENYIYRIGMVTAAIFLAGNCLIVYVMDKQLIRSKLALLMGIIGALGLALSAVLSYKEELYIHIVATFVLFISYGIYMTLISFNGNLLEISVRVKKICAITVIVAVVISLFLFLLTCLHDYSLLKAFLEWVGSIAIVVFNLTYFIDVKGSEICVTGTAEHVTDKNEQKKIN